MNARFQPARPCPDRDDPQAVEQALRDLIIQLARQRARADHMAAIHARSE